MEASVNPASDSKVEVPKGHQANPDYRPAPSPSVTGKAAYIDVSLKAIEAIRKQIAERGTSCETTSLRVGIRGGGCSGFSYVIEFHDGAPHARDKVYSYKSEDGSTVRVVVDPKSLVYLNGTILDWEQTLLQQGFKFRNPNEKTSCGLRNFVHGLMARFDR